MISFRGLDLCPRRDCEVLLQDGTCRFRRADVGATDTGFVDIPEGNEEALMMAVATVGPVSVGLDASRMTFHEYRHGIYEDEHCSSKELDHGVLVVGYGKMDGKKYWLIKNRYLIKMNWNAQHRIKHATRVGDDARIMSSYSTYNYNAGKVSCILQVSDPIPVDYSI